MRVEAPGKAKPVPGILLSDPGSLLVGLSGFEPLTSRLSGVRSNQLSYRPPDILSALAFQYQRSLREL